mmetsp:Transcript_42726/g.70071  ORF Transcript_42726/g.70071 Transcript_42726/m.70071 type:complete len:250 (-) Transcript_42726:160-909(-)
MANKEPKNIYYIGVGRFTDHVIVASHSDSSVVDDHAVRALIEDPGTHVTPRQRYSMEGDWTTVHFMSDERKRVYVVVTKKSYPSRVVFTLIEEMQSRFLDKTAEKSLTAKDGALSKTTKSIFSEISKKYDDPKNVDQLASIQDKIDVTKTVMSENIQNMLQNTEKLEDINDKAEHLGDQAKLFKKQGTELQRVMWWKLCKMRLMIAIIVVLLVGGIALTVVLSFTEGSGGGGSSGSSSNDNNGEQVGGN